MTDPGSDNAVYVFAGSDVTPDDMDGLDDGSSPEPVTTALVAMNDEGMFDYTAGFLRTGEYTVAFTCQADQEAVPENGSDADDDIAFQPSAGRMVRVEAGETATVDFND